MVVKKEKHSRQADQQSVCQGHAQRKHEIPFPAGIGELTDETRSVRRLRQANKKP